MGCKGLIKTIYYLMFINTTVPWCDSKVNTIWYFPYGLVLYNFDPKIIINYYMYTPRCRESNNIKLNKYLFMPQDHSFFQLEMCLEHFYHLWGWVLLKTHIVNSSEKRVPEKKLQKLFRIKVIFAIIINNEIIMK